MVAAGRIAAAAQVDQSYSPGGANLHFPTNTRIIGLVSHESSPNRLTCSSVVARFSMFARVRNTQTTPPTTAAAIACNAT